MTVKKGSDHVGSFFRKGDTGRKYYYSSKNKESESTAKAKAEAYEEKDTTASVSLESFTNSRNIFMFDYFDEISSQAVVKSIMQLNAESSEDINLFINSNGGVVDDLNAIVDAIESSKAKVNTICLGIAASCGAFLLAMGSGKRYIGQNSRSMVHKVRGWVSGDIDSMEERLKQAKDLGDQVLSKFCDITGQAKDTMDEVLYKRDIFLSADETVALGIADAVLLNTEDLIKGIDTKSVAYNSEQGIDSLVFSSMKSRYSEKAVLTQDKKPEGEPLKMDREKAIAYLKETCSVDVITMQADLAKTSAENVNLRADLTKEQDAHKATKEQLAVVKEAQVKADKDAILEKMVADGKIAEAEKASYEKPFGYMSVDECKELAEKLTPKVNMERQSSGGELPKNLEAGETADGDDSKEMASEDEKIKAYAKEHNCSYIEAAMEV